MKKAMLRVFSLFLSRFFISLIFLLAGIQKILNWYETEKQLIIILSDWQGHLGTFLIIQNSFTFLVSQSSLLLMLAVLFELVGSLMILIGFKERIGALLLILFLVPVTILFHPFWFLEDGPREIQMTMFLKNLAILGGLIVVSIHGIRSSSKEEPSSFVGFN